MRASKGRFFTVWPRESVTCEQLWKARSTEVTARVSNLKQSSRVKKKPSSAISQPHQDDGRPKLISKAFNAHQGLCSALHPLISPTCFISRYRRDIPKVGNLSRACSSAILRWPSVSGPSLQLIEDPWGKLLPGHRANPGHALQASAPLQTAGCLEMCRNPGGSGEAAWGMRAL